MIPYRAEPAPLGLTAGCMLGVCIHCHGTIMGIPTIDNPTDDHIQVFDWRHISDINPAECA